MKWFTLIIGALFAAIALMDMAQATEAWKRTVHALFAVFFIIGSTTYLVAILMGYAE